MFRPDLFRPVMILACLGQHRFRPDQGGPSEGGGRGLIPRKSGGPKGGGPEGWGAEFSRDPREALCVEFGLEPRPEFYEKTSKRGKQE